MNADNQHTRDPNNFDMYTLLVMQKKLMDKVPHDLPDHTVHKITAGIGVIEETLEYLNAIGRKPWRPVPLPKEKQLEELTDIVFFLLELIILSGFSWFEIKQEYEKKWKTNISRYEAGEKGDYSWDDRATKTEL